MARGDAERGGDGALPHLARPRELESRSRCDSRGSCCTLAEGLCRERGCEYRDDRLQRFFAELDGRLGCRAWFFGHYHGDKWCNAKHRLIYRDIVPVEDAAPGSRNLLEAL